MQKEASYDSGSISRYRQAGQAALLSYRHRNIRPRVPCGKGKGTCLPPVFVDKKYILRAGSVFYIAPAKPHEYHPLAGEWVTNWLVFRGQHAGELMAAMGFQGFAYSDHFDEDKCGRIFSRIFSAAADPVNGGENSSALLYEYILAMRSSMFSRDEEKRSGNDISSLAVRYIDSNYAEDIRAETLAALSGVSVQHFCRVFRAETSMRPLEYLARRRISEAKSLLVNTDREIGDIGKAVGYEDRNYFSIVFRRIEGVSPREYRRSRGTVLM